MTSLPRPTQKPRPKFYIAATQTPESFEFAGTNGYSLMAIPIGPIGPLLELYRKAWRDAGHPGDGEVMVAFHMFCHEDAQLARDIARPPFEEYFRALNEAVGDWARGTTSKDYRDYDKSMRRLRSFTLDGQIESGGAWVGTPDEIKTIIRRVIDAMGNVRARLAADQFRQHRRRARRRNRCGCSRPQVMPEFAEHATPSAANPSRWHPSGIPGAGSRGRRLQRRLSRHGGDGAAQRAARLRRAVRAAAGKRPWAQGRHSRRRHRRPGLGL